LQAWEKLRSVPAAGHRTANRNKQDGRHQVDEWHQGPFDDLHIIPLAELEQPVPYLSGGNRFLRTSGITFLPIRQKVDVLPRKQALRVEHSD
jgi:hypothetical protein